MRYITAATVLLAVISGLLYNHSNSPIDPAAFFPPKVPGGTGLLNVALNSSLLRPEKLAAGQVDGPEDLVFDSDGSLFCGCRDGWIKHIWPSGTVENYAHIGGHPLGLAWMANGDLLVCEPGQGLLAVDTEGSVRCLVSGLDGRKFKLVDDAAVAKDGKIYFSDATDKFEFKDYFLDILEGRPHGRLLVHNPQTGTTKVLIDGLGFANGVALSKEEDFVLVCETWKYQVTRLWLRGPRAGTKDVLIDNLPGFPDNIKTNDDGTFWIALSMQRSVFLDLLHRFPLAKAFIARLPTSFFLFWMRICGGGSVVKVNQEGRVITSLQDPWGTAMHTITTALEKDGVLYLGSLFSKFIGTVQLH